MENANEEVAHNEVFESLKQAFLFYELEKAQDGSFVVKVKDTNLEVSDTETIAKVKYANLWFNEITRNASRSNLGEPPKNDEGLLDIAFGRIGEETFNKVQESFTNAFERASKNNGTTFGSDVITNLQNADAEIKCSYRSDVIKALCATEEQVKFANMQGRHPEVFQAQTMEFMSNLFLSQQAEEGLFNKAKDVINKTKDAVSNAFGHFTNHQNEQYCSFNTLKTAFQNYDFEKAQDGSFVVIAKDTGVRVTNPKTIAKVEYANLWFNEITRNASRSNLGEPPKNDEGLLDIAFGRIGEETFNKVQESFTNAFEKASKNNGSTFGSDVITNLQNAEMKTIFKYGPDVVDTLCKTKEQVEFENTLGEHPEVFMAKTMEFMSQGYISKQAEKGLLWKAKNVVVKVKNAVADALGLSDVSTKSNDQEMSR